MSNSGNVQNKWNQLQEKVGPGLAKTGKVCTTVGKWLFRLRKLFLALPVAIACGWLAVQNNQRLPDEVGLNLLSDGTFSEMVPRDVAVLGPVAVTALCLLLMMCSRRTLYPWLISIFSLVLPVIILVSNVFPA